MKKLEEIQRRKVISAYGGSGSIIETLENGSLLIDDYDRWPCYRNIQNCDPVDNPRLLKKVQGICDTIIELKKIPTPDLDERKYKANNGDLDKTIRAKRFPEWFYCPKCRRLHKLDDWNNLWNETTVQSKQGKISKKLDNKFDDYFPACYACSHKKKKKDGKDSTNYFRQSLEQVRFVLASLDSGNLMDIPFDCLWGLDKSGDAWILDKQQPVSEELYYRTTKGSDGLQSLYIKKGAENNAPVINMTTIYNKYIVYTQGSNKGAYRVILRNGNNVYFPNILSCIYLPLPSESQIEDVIDKRKHNYTIDEIVEKTGLSKLQVEEIVRQASDNSKRDEDFVMGEFYYITNNSIYNSRTNQRREKDFWAIRYPNLKYNHIKGFYALKELKETSVLMSYTRVSPSTQKWWNNGEIKDTNPHPVYPFSKKNPTYMPAVEAYGEGLLFEIDTTEINKGDVLEFAHTFCHLLMKELEFTCGYPVTSLREKIYDEEDTIGFLIYTIQGSEGSYGGLVSLMPSDTNSDGSNNDAKLLNLIASATERAKDCPNDPICMNDERHPGHCFACVDLPETSCERWNNNLNRKTFLKYMDLETSQSENENSVSERIVLDD